ncbi:MAG: 2-phospho-L-lactate guanylyltransferase [Candidatus Rokubacteria bacterium GWA2_73_35]|nr:MAG: 2-phospho-L-lactate guanylyltransferase [Candidatus Rokubacteria bacterium GWA2_73_35]
MPVKDLAAAKQRLVPTLAPDERRALARAMLGDVLAALGAAGLDRVWVVTRDAEVAALAAARGAEPLAPPTPAENGTHTAAVAFAQAEAGRRGARVFLTVPGDVPCVTAAELAALAAAARPGAPAFAPSRSGLGTNGVALAPPGAMPLTFGEPSFDGHLAAARARGLEPRVLALPGLALDVDTPEDLAALRAAGARTESARLVAGWRARTEPPAPPAGHPRSEAASPTEPPAPPAGHPRSEAASWSPLQ